VRRKWKIPRVVLRVKNPSRASSAPRLESRPQNKSSSQGVRRPSATQPASHAFPSPRQFSISAVHKTATVALSPRLSLCFSFRFFSLHGVLFSSTTLVNLVSSPTSPPTSPFCAQRNRLSDLRLVDQRSIAVSLYSHGPQNRRRDHDFERNPCQKGRLDLLATCFI